ncbi:HelD family protein [Micromonospora inyonensis]|uniref:DNA helicase IV n=1 Tax=Micromonospora inyonensis TaxID=47866 RepID=A0A1C6SJ29_9ACTN|nr:AAA family ATPase [Micromonospora inyonensis]SCL29443.1 DNA helicase IV [Micromonospora inyonensis]
MTLPSDPTTGAEPTRDLAPELTYLARVHAARNRALDTARLRVDTGATVAGDGYTAETLGRMLRGHARDLAGQPHVPPYFGRLDFLDKDDEHPGARYYVGRRHVADVDGSPLVLDWRAPVSRRFYQASADHPEGVRRRRRFGWAVRPGRPAELTGFEDEDLLVGATGAGPGRLVAEEIERPRVGPMRDIVATIQPDQDRLVRADLARSICVQGAPGTGKTAVGLHRAAYLLYTHAARLRRSGVLVLGPNPAFLRHVREVLPALGEADVTQTTLAELLARVPVRGHDAADAAMVKQNARMAEVLRRALAERIRLPEEPLMVPDGSYRWRVSVEALRRLVVEVRAEQPPYATGRERLRARVVQQVQRHAETRDTPGPAWVRRISRSRPVAALLDRVWPAVRPEELVAEVLGDPELLDRVAGDLLAPAERAAIRWPRPRTPRTAPWTEADLVLIDEAAGLLDRPTGYGHVVVDEAQDLSPMQCRAVARRAVHASLTILGDLAQGTTPWAASSWREQVAHLGKPDAAVLPLTAGFRVPGPVVTLANRLLATLGVDVPPTVPVRGSGELRIHPVVDPVAALPALVRGALDRPGSLAVIAVETAVPVLAAALQAAGLEPTGPEPTDGRLTLLAAGQVKGLEYDHVIVVEPAAIVAAEPRGARRLYVVLTRAVSRLDVMHAAPLPAGLAG